MINPCTLSVPEHSALRAAALMLGQFRCSRQGAWLSLRISSEHQKCCLTAVHGDGSVHHPAKINHGLMSWSATYLYGATLAWKPLIQYLGCYFQGSYLLSSNCCTFAKMGCSSLEWPRGIMTWGRACKSMSRCRVAEGWDCSACSVLAWHADVCGPAAAGEDLCPWLPGALVVLVSVRRLPTGVLETQSC